MKLYVEVFPLREEYPKSTLQYNGMVHYIFFSNFHDFDFATKKGSLLLKTVKTEG